MDTFFTNKKRWLSIEDFDGEVWKRIENYPLYYVSNFGRIKSDERRVRYVHYCGKEMFRILKGKILSLSKGFYAQVGLKNEGKRQKTHLVHRLVAEAFIENDKNKPFVNHKDGNKLNNRVENLEWCTYRENTDHAVANNLVAYGNRSNKSKLTEYQVVEIKSLLAKGYTCKDVAKKYNVHLSTISLINKGKNWHRVPNVNEKEEFCLWNHLLQKSLDGTILHEYNSVNEAHKITGFSTTQIRRCCAGKRESFQGYKWEFIKLRGNTIL